MKHLAIFASGSGTNAENICKYFKAHNTIQPELIVSDNKCAYVLERASTLGIPKMIINREDLSSMAFIDQLKSKKIDVVVLAGFLKLIPPIFIREFKGRIINIHPALLPKYGGKGMYGDHVHKAVIAAEEKESGITIHHVNEQYDEGCIIFQAKCDVTASDSPLMLAAKIHELEMQHFPKVIEEFCISLG